MLKDKALENLAAGELLLERGFPNAAASRLYSAMYQAAVYRLGVRNLRPERFRSGAVEWDHSMVLNNLSVIRAEPGEKGLFAMMRQLRAKADYDGSPVHAFELETRMDWIRHFVRRLAQ